MTRHWIGNGPTSSTSRVRYRVGSVALAKKSDANNAVVFRRAKFGTVASPWARESKPGDRIKAATIAGNRDRCVGGKHVAAPGGILPELTTDGVATVDRQDCLDSSRGVVGEANGVTLAPSTENPPLPALTECGKRVTSRIHQGHRVASSSDRMGPSSSGDQKARQGGPN